MDENHLETRTVPDPTLLMSLPTPKLERGRMLSAITAANRGIGKRSVRIHRCATDAYKRDTNQINVICPLHRAEKAHRREDAKVRE